VCPGSLGWSLTGVSSEGILQVLSVMGGRQQLFHEEHSAGSISPLPAFVSHRAGQLMPTRTTQTVCCSCCRLFSSWRAPGHRFRCSSLFCDLAGELASAFGWSPFAELRRAGQRSPCPAPVLRRASCRPSPSFSASLNAG